VDRDKLSDDCFSTDKSETGKIIIYPELVQKRLGELLKQVDLSRFIL
jgi:ATP-dependent protease HslVU (ClpYQ) ATPase subunit